MNYVKYYHQSRSINRTNRPTLLLYKPLYCLGRLKAGQHPRQTLAPDTMDLNLVSLIVCIVETVKMDTLQARFIHFRIELGFGEGLIDMFLDKNYYQGKMFPSNLLNVWLQIKAIFLKICLIYYKIMYSSVPDKRPSMLIHF